MPRLIKVGSAADELEWNVALRQLQADDVLLLEPGFYELPQGATLADVTVKGMGSGPEDTTILGYLGVAEESRFVTLENLCINTNTDNNSLYVPFNANTYLTLRNCIIKGAGTDTATVALNGKVTAEFYSSRIINGSLSVFSNADFRLEMNDSIIDYPSSEYCAVAIEGKGTAIINNSEIHGSTNTFSDTNIELDINNSILDVMVLRGQVWLNMLNSRVISEDDICVLIGDKCWNNILNCEIEGGFQLEKESRTILQNTHVNRLIACDQARLTATNSFFLTHADFQDQAQADLTRISFNGDPEFEYFLALNKQAQVRGRNLILNSNGSELSVQDDAVFNASVYASDREQLEILCDKVPNVKIYGIKWTAKKN